MIKPRTTISLGTSGWVLMVSTVFLTDVGVSLNPSSQCCRSIPHFWGVHTGQYGQFLVRILVRNKFLVALLGYECLVVINNLVNHIL